MDNYKDMVIKNIDVSDILVEKVGKCIDFIKETIEKGTSGFLYHNHITKVNPPLPDMPIWVMDDVNFKNASLFVHSVPIYLIDPEDPKVEFVPKEDLLGGYVSGTGDSPYILLYVKKIHEETSPDDERFKMLLTKVLIHELMHAVLDLSNNKDYYNNSSTKNQSSSCPFALVHKHMDRQHTVELNKEYTDWREEAYANALTLHLIEMSGNEILIEYARNFMINQDVQYAVGASLSKISCIYEQTDDYLKEKNLKENNLTKDYDIDKWNKLRRDWVSCVKHIKNNIENKVDPMHKLTELENQIRAFVSSH